VASRGKKNSIWVPPLPGVNKSQSGDTMDQQRKHAILFAATLLCARKLMPMMEDNPDTSKELLTEHYRWRVKLQTLWDAAASLRTHIGTGSIGMRAMVSSPWRVPPRAVPKECFST
jgi:hypothetical protein